MLQVLNTMGCMTFSDKPWFKNVDISHVDTEQQVIAAKLAGPVVMVFEGGEDINPALYGQENRHSSFNRRRDAWEMLCYALALRHDIPVLGICRGHQLIAALKGGDLIQDIRTELGASHISGHEITFQTPESDADLQKVLAFIEVMTSCPTGRPNVVNSLHHQAVKRLPSDGVSLAQHKDGTYEAIWYPNGLTVQWHPEFLGHHEMLRYMFTRFYGEQNDPSANNDGIRDRGTGITAPGSELDTLV